MNKNFVIGIAYRAGKILINGRNNISVERKNNFNDIGSFVTKADKDSEQFIKQAILNEFPDHNFCGEESGLLNKGSDFTWYVDPLDGTYNYARGHSTWGVSIGLAKNQNPILGVLYFPDLDKMIYAKKGEGAFSNEQKIKVSNLDFEEGCYCIPSYSYQGLVQAKLNIINIVKVSKIHHCTTYDFMSIAEGNAELILSGTLGPWDSCAGVCIIREAGGFAKDGNGNEWILSSNYLIATNKFSNRLLTKINESSSEVLDRNFLIPEVTKQSNNKLKTLKH